MIKKKQSNLNNKVEEVAKVIKKVLKEVPVELICPRCGAQMVITGGGPSGSDLHCNKCGLNNTKVI